MKAKVELEIDKDDLTYELKELVREIAESEIRGMIKQSAKEMVTAEIDKILHPLVLKVLTEEKFDFRTGYHDYNDKYSLDNKLKSMVVDYMNRPSYLYSSDRRTPSERYMPSSSGGDNMSLINHIVKDEIKFYVDTNFVPKVKALVEELVINKKQIEESLKEQTKKMVLQMIVEKT